MNQIDQIKDLNGRALVPARLLIGCESIERQRQNI
jgi:hypothetical protein